MARVRRARVTQHLAKRKASASSVPATLPVISALLAANTWQDTYANTPESGPFNVTAIGGSLDLTTFANMRRLFMSMRKYPQTLWLPQELGSNVRYVQIAFDKALVLAVAL